MAMKIVIVILLLAIFVALGFGLLHLLSGRGDSVKLAKSLTWRVGISIGLFVLLMIGMATGLIQPHGL